jgi:hypothetical protein
MWVFTATVPSSGLRWHNLSAEAGDGANFGYTIMDFPSFFGFDPNASSVPYAHYYHAYKASQTVSTSSEAAEITFISTNAAAGQPLNLTPFPGQDVFNPSPTPSYSIACVYGVFPASANLVGGNFNQNEAGWIVSDALDFESTSNFTATEPSAANDVSGTRTTSSFAAAEGDLLYLGISEDYPGTPPPTITDPILQWGERGNGSVSTMNKIWVYYATVPMGGISGHTFTLKATDGGYFAYMLIDLRGALGFDPNSSATPKLVPFSASTTPSVSITTNTQAVFLGFFGNNGDTAATLAPDAGEEIFGASQNPHHSISFIFATGAAGQVTIGGTYSASATGDIYGDAVDLPNSGDASVTELKSLNDTSGTSTVSGVTAAAGSTLYFVVAQDYSSGGAPVLTDSVLDWTVRFHEAVSGDSAIWAYTAIVPTGGISGHSFTIKATDNLDKGYLLVDLSGFVGFDRNVSVPGSHYNSASNCSTSIGVSASYAACYMAFVSVNMATTGVSLTPSSSNETIMNTNPGPYYAISMIYEFGPPGLLTLGGSFTSAGSPHAEPGWIISDAADV